MSLQPLNNLIQLIQIPLYITIPLLINLINSNNFHIFTQLYLNFQLFLMNLHQNIKYFILFYLFSCFLQTLANDQRQFWWLLRVILFYLCRAIRVGWGCYVSIFLGCCLVVYVMGAWMGLTLLHVFLPGCRCWLILFTLFLNT